MPAAGVEGRSPAQALRSATHRSHRRHYPAGTSKWNPIEHRLFSEISKNWAGVPLIDLETILAYIRSTTTRAGLRVSAYLNDTQYQKGIKITDQEMQRLNISSDDQIPRWNYTIKPR